VPLNILDSKINPRKHNVHESRSVLLCMTLWTLCSRSTVVGARKPKVSKANSIKACWLSGHTFSCLATLFDAYFKAACPTVKASTPNPTSGETLIKFTHACFSPTHMYTITSVDLSVDLLVSQEVYKGLLLHCYFRPPKYIKKWHP